MTESATPPTSSIAVPGPNPNLARAHGREFAVLDGLRGVAALAVALRHLPFLWPAGYPTGVLRESYLAVDFFFVLSGFVLAHAYSGRFRTDLALPKFMSIRLIRLYPLYALAFLISLVVAAIRIHYGKFGIVDLACNAFFAVLFLPTLCGPHFLFPMNGAAWSLFFEAVANFAFGWLGSRFNTWLLVFVTAAGGLALLVAVPLGWFGFGTPLGAIDAGNTWNSLGAGIARVGYSFFAGVIVYRLWKIRAVRIEFPSIVVVAALCVVLAASPTANYELGFDLVATLLVFPLIVFFGASLREDARLTRLYAFLGEISYGAYVLQFPVFELTSLTILIVTGQTRVGTSVAYASTNLIMLVVAAVLAEHYFDYPVRRYLTRRLLGK